MGTVLLFLFYFIITFLAGFGLISLLFLLFYLDYKESGTATDSNNAD